jgi:23S rRNA pseudouridine1911/1915/1917 synthase
LKLVDYAKDHLVVVAVNDVGELIARGAVTVNGRVGGINDEVSAIDVIEADVAGLEPQEMPLVIAHEDDRVVVVDKPAGTHVHPLGDFTRDTLLNGLLWHCGARAGQPWGRWRPRPLHRLDRAVSGLIAFAKRETLVVSRRYVALVHGALEGNGTIDAPLGRDPAFDYRRAVVADGQRAVTRWRAVERRGEQTLVELVLETGRTHQIRAHLASIGHPIVDDGLYIDGRPTTTILLHASELTIGDVVVRSQAPFA